MQPVNNINTLPTELVFNVSQNLENSFEIMSLAGTSKNLLSIFKNLPEDAFFRSCNDVNKKNPDFTIFYFNSFDYISRLFNPVAKPYNSIKSTLYPNIFFLNSIDFISTPCELITIDLFTKTITRLCKSFPLCKPYIIEGSIRKSLATDANKGIMKKLSDKYLADAKDPEIITEVKAVFEIELPNSKNEIERRIKQLHKNTEPSEEFFIAEKAFWVAKDHFLDLCRIHNVGVPTFPILPVPRFNQGAAPDVVQEAYAQLRDKSRALHVFEQAFLDQRSENAFLSEKLPKVINQLADLDKAAENHLTQQGDFFAELSQDITSENMQLRFEELNKIINR